MEQRICLGRRSREEGCPDRSHCSLTRSPPCGRSERGPGAKTQWEGAKRHHSAVLMDHHGDMPHDDLAGAQRCCAGSSTLWPPWFLQWSHRPTCLRWSPLASPSIDLQRCYARGHVSSRAESESPLGHSPAFVGPAANVDRPTLRKRALLPVVQGSAMCLYPHHTKTIIAS
jgi:hypothetical protein